MNYKVNRPFAILSALQQLASKYPSVKSERVEGYVDSIDEHFQHIEINRLCKLIDGLAMVHKFYPSLAEIHQKLSSEPGPKKKADDFIKFEEEEALEDTRIRRFAVENIKELGIPQELLDECYDKLFSTVYAPGARPDDDLVPFIKSNLKLLFYSDLHRANYDLKRVAEVALRGAAHAAYYETAKEANYENCVGDYVSAKTVYKSIKSEVDRFLYMGDKLVKSSTESYPLCTALEKLRVVD